MADWPIHMISGSQHMVDCGTTAAWGNRPLPLACMTSSIPPGTRLKHWACPAKASHSQFLVQCELEATTCVVLLPVCGQLQHQQKVVLHLGAAQPPRCLLLLLLGAAATAATAVAVLQGAHLRWQLLSCLGQQLHAVAVQR